MHDTNRNTLNPANIAERNMRGNKEDKSRPPLPKPDEENVDSSKTEERKSGRSESQKKTNIGRRRNKKKKKYNKRGE